MVEQSKTLIALLNLFIFTTQVSKQDFLEGNICYICIIYKAYIRLLPYLFIDYYLQTIYLQYQKPLDLVL